MSPRCIACTIAIVSPSVPASDQPCDGAFEANQQRREPGTSQQETDQIEAPMRLSLMSLQLLGLVTG